MGQPTGEIRETLVAPTSRHTGVPVQSIEGNVSVWEHFAPSGRAKRPSVMSFVKEVRATFNVFLTEEEWEDPTPEELVQIIHAKCADPGKSIADWHREREALQKGAKVAFGFLNILFGPGTFFVARGPMSQRLRVTLTILLVTNTFMLLSFWKEWRQLGSKQN